MGTNKPDAGQGMVTTIQSIACGGTGGEMTAVDAKDGKIVRSCSVRVVRDGIVIHEGSLASLKRFKDDAREVAENYECGLTVEKFNDIKEGDIFECFVMEQIKE